MSESITFKRTNVKGKTESTIEIIEVNLDDPIDSINVGGKEIPIQMLDVHVPGKNVKGYVVVEKLSGKGITSIDLFYGEIPIAELKKDESLKRQYFSKILSKDNLELITRKCCGALPTVGKSAYGDLEIKEKYDRDLIIGIRDQIQLFSFKEIHEESAKTATRTPEPKRTGHPLWESFKKYANKNVKDYPGNEPEPQSTSLSQELPEAENTTSKSGIIFYESGGTIINGKYCTRINYIVKDSETLGKAEINSILVSELDTDRLGYDDIYRKRFVNQVCTPSRLKNTRDKILPYVGSFNSDGNFENDFDISQRVAELREEYAR